MNPTRRKLLNRANYFGALSTMDRQGRVLVPALLRESAHVDGEVVVMGQLNYLEVWNHAIFRERLESEPLTDADFQTLSEMGI